MPALSAVRRCGAQTFAAILRLSGITNNNAIRNNTKCPHAVISRLTEPIMQIRPYRPDDLPVLKEIMVEAFDGVSIDQGIEREFGPINGHDWKWRKAQHLDIDAEREPDGILVVEDEGRIIGFISTWQEKEAGIGHIPNISFRPECRGRGLGRKLIEMALDRFRENGLTHAKIETLVQNDIGNHLYESIGFREVARQIHFAADLSQTTRLRHNVASCRSTDKCEQEIKESRNSSTTRSTERGSSEPSS